MWGHLQVSFCWYLVLIQYRVFPSGQNTSKSAARRKCLFYNYLLLRFKFDYLKRTVPWCDQWSPNFIFPLQLLPAMLNHIQDHLWESMFHIIQVSFITSFYITCCYNMLFSPFKSKDCLRGSQTDLPWLWNSKVSPRTKAGLQTGFFS